MTSIPWKMEMGTGRQKKRAEKIQKFEDLEVWQLGVRLSIDLYTDLRDSKDYGFRDQMQRAAISIPSNIAEGYDRKGNREFIQFLYIAKSSCAELRTQLYIAQDTGILSKKRATEYIEQTRRISRMLYRLIEVRKTNFK
jgi:four helix bundle protein